ncbi:MAG: threonine/serine exporter family protein, partial [Gemmatimonadaceae bacterium]
MLPVDAIPDGGSASAGVPAEMPGDRQSLAARRFVLQLARALHQHGTPAHRLEAALTSAAGQLGLQAEFFSTPTSIMVGIGELEQQRVHLLRVEPGEPNLGQLTRLADITRRVVERDIGPAEGLALIDAMDREPPTYARWLVIVAFMLSSAAVASFLK